MKRRLGQTLFVLLAALTLIGCQSGGQAKEDQADQKVVKKQEPRGPAVTGKLQSAPLSGEGFQGAVLVLDVTPEGQVSGVFEGGYQQKRFEVPLTGEVGEDGTLTASGQASDGTVQVSGPLQERGFAGEVSGEVFTEAFSLPLAAQPAAE